MVRNKRLAAVSKCRESTTASRGLVTDRLGHVEVMLMVVWQLRLTHVLWCSCGVIVMHLLHVFSSKIQCHCIGRL